MTYTLAGLLMLAASLVGVLDVIRTPVHNTCTTHEETADQAGSHLIANQARDERITTR